MLSIDYDGSALERIYVGLSPRERNKALRSAFRRAAYRVRSVARRKLKDTGLRHATALGSSIRAKVFKRKAGFSVSVQKSMYTPRGAGKKPGLKSRRPLPLQRWFEFGTKERTKRGALKKYGFMYKAKEETEGSVTDYMRNEVLASIRKLYS